MTIPTQASSSTSTTSSSSTTLSSSSVISTISEPSVLTLSSENTSHTTLLPLHTTGNTIPNISFDDNFNLFNSNTATITNTTSVNQNNNFIDCFMFENNMNEIRFVDVSELNKSNQHYNRIDDVSYCHDEKLSNIIVRNRKQNLMDILDQAMKIVNEVEENMLLHRSY